MYGHEMLMSTQCCYHGYPHRWPALERGDRVYEMAEEFLELRVT